MSSPAIIVENLSKKFRIGTGGGPGYHRLSEAAAGIPRALYNSARNLFPDSSPRPETGRGAGGEGPLSTLNPHPSPLNSSPDFWALKDVSFEVQPGEVVGIIGRNGAGKSTLLKILSRITEPTSGRFGVRGRVASLLEVGTGFHPELTGRENIYVSGVTLGMTRAEIKKRFDEIVDFSGVEKFLDTPVKHYSSGMQVRLGFAVAAHLESEILIIDEVLAVGDAEFRQKSIKAMERASGSGRTILMVTHNQNTLVTTCTSALLLQQGGLKQFKTVADAVDAYNATLSTSARRMLEFETSEKQLMSIDRAYLVADENAFDISESIEFELGVKVFEPIPNAYVAITIHDSYGQLVYWTCDIESNRFETQQSGRLRTRCQVPAHTFLPGHYLANFAICTTDRREIQYTPNKQLSFSVIDNTSRLSACGIQRPGLFAVKSNWTTFISE